MIMLIRVLGALAFYLRSPSASLGAYNVYYDINIKSIHSQLVSYFFNWVLTLTILSLLYFYLQCLSKQIFYS